MAVLPEARSVVCPPQQAAAHSKGPQGLACASAALGFGGPWCAASGERIGPRGVQVRQEGAYRLRPLLGSRESQLFWSSVWTAREPVGEGKGVGKAGGDIPSSSADLAQAGCRSSGEHWQPWAAGVPPVGVLEGKKVRGRGIPPAREFGPLGRGVQPRRG